MNEQVNQTHREILNKFYAFQTWLKTNNEVSDCCSATVWNPSGEWAICMDCKEPCDAIKL